MASWKRVVGILGDDGDANTVLLQPRDIAWLRLKHVFSPERHSARCGGSVQLRHVLQPVVGLGQNRAQRISDVHYACANENRTTRFSYKVFNLQEKMPAISRKPNREMLRWRGQT